MEQSSTVKAHSWLFTLLMFIIPGINIIYFIGLLLGLSRYKSKVGFARALLAVTLIAFVVQLVWISVVYLKDDPSKINSIGDYLKNYYISLYNNWKSFVVTHIPDTIKNMFAK